MLGSTAPSLPGTAERQGIFVSWFAVELLPSRAHTVPAMVLEVKMMNCTLVGIGINFNYRLLELLRISSWSSL